MTKVIETKNISKKYKDLYAVKELNLTIYQGELFALLGVNGAGKTTTIKMLSCLILPTEGSATIHGYDIEKDIINVKEITNVSPQETAIAPNLTVYENLDLIGGIYGLRKGELSEKIEEIIQNFELENYRKVKAKTLSGGWQRRLSIAMALISNPQVLFLDEPTLGLDVIARRELWNQILKLKGNVTIILTTHYLEEVIALADRVGIMTKGKLKAVGTIDEIKSMANKNNFEDAFIQLATGE